MKIAIISDIHDNLENLEYFLAWAKENEIEEIICCGDFGSVETLEKLADSFEKDVHLVRGNADLFPLNEDINIDNVIDYGKVGFNDFAGRKIGFCHEPFLFDKVIKLGDPELVFYGHTHKPWQEEKDGLMFINPGTLGGVLGLGTFASLDTKEKKIMLHKTDN